jgi:N-acetylneuraminate synthase
MKPFKLGGREFSYLSPYIIAEIGVNHEGSLERAKRLIEQAAEGGAHAAKFQTYKAELLAARDSSPAYWDLSEEPADSQFELFQRWDNFSDEDYRELAQHCRECGVDFLSTPFDLPSVDFLAPLMPAIKVASADLTNIPQLRRVGARGLPVILSTGASRFDEIATAVQELRRAGAPEVALLHCVLNYPTAACNAQLAQIAELGRIFGGECSIGYSDHVKPDEDGALAAEMAVLMGAVIIEKHFTDDKTARGNDHYHAMDTRDLAELNRRLARYRELYGKRERDISGETAAILNARRRIVAARNINAGEELGPDALVPLRSNRGIEIAHWDRVVGRTAARAITEGEPLDWADIR